MLRKCFATAAAVVAALTPAGLCIAVCLLISWQLVDALAEIKGPYGYIRSDAIGGVRAVFLMIIFALFIEGSKQAKEIFLKKRYIVKYPFFLIVAGMVKLLESNHWISQNDLMVMFLPLWGIVVIGFLVGDLYLRPKWEREEKERRDAFSSW